MITVQSIQVGKVRSEGDQRARDPWQRRRSTGFYKVPVPGPVDVGPQGIEGDAVADTIHHGGTDKAILCYPTCHYDAWTREHPELKMGPGALAENLTLSEISESDVCIGDLYQVGSCRLQVSQPRQPCWKIARRWGVKTLTKEVTTTGRTGWYVRVLQVGQIKLGDECQLLNRPHPDWSIARANDIMFGRVADRLAVFQLRGLAELAEAWRAEIA